MSEPINHYATSRVVPPVLTPQIVADMRGDILAARNSPHPALKAEADSVHAERLLALLDRISFQPIEHAPTDGELVVCISGSHLWFDRWLPNIPENWVNHQVRVKATHFYRLPMSAPAA